MRKMYFQRICVLSSILIAVILAGCPKKPSPPAISTQLPAETPIPAPQPEVILRLHGSPALGKTLIQDLAKAFLEGQGAVDIQSRSSDPHTIEVQGSFPAQPLPQLIEIRFQDSAAVFKELAAKTCDLGFVTRKIETEEWQSLSAPASQPLPESANDLNLEEFVVALDAVAIIVNSDNPLHTLNKDQLVKIFTERLSTWSALGIKGRGQIHLYIPQDSSETCEAFQKLVLGDIPFSDQAIRVDTEAMLVENIANDPAGIGFVRFANVQDARALALTEEGLPPIRPDKGNIVAETYLLEHRVYFYLPPHGEPSVAQKFVEFTLSQPGQNIVAQHGFIDLHTPLSVELTSRKTLLSHILFDYNSSKLTDKALRDINRIMQLLRSSEQYAKRTLALYGFCDNRGSEAYNQQLSKDRALVVNDAFVAEQIIPSSVEGRGKKNPIATNETEEGRSRNRRVEVWLIASQPVISTDPERASGPNRAYQGATEIALNAEEDGTISYDEGDQTDWYQIQVVQKGTLTVHVQRNSGTDFEIEFYKGAGNGTEENQPPEDPPLKTLIMSNEARLSIPFNEIAPATYYIKIIAPRAGDFSSYTLSTTFIQPSEPLPPEPDANAPIITILAPEPESSTTQDSILITGKIEDENAIRHMMINNDSINLIGEQATRVNDRYTLEFTHQVSSLKLGINGISITVWDEFGNMGMLNFNIYRRPNTQ